MGSDPNQHRPVARLAWAAVSLVVLLITPACHPEPEGDPHDPTFGRRLFAADTGDSVYLGWRLLPGDPADVAFDVYRADDGETFAQINDAPITVTTDFMDPEAAGGDETRYRLHVLVDGQDVGHTAPVTIRMDLAERPYVPIPLQGGLHRPEAGAR